MHPLEPAWEGMKREFDAASSNLASDECGRVAHRFNEILRRFRRYESQADWLAILLDGGAAFVRDVAIFSLDDGTLRLEAQNNLPLPERYSFLAASAAAFASAIESKDPVVALRTPGEVTPALSTSQPGRKALIVPILNGTRVVAVLFAHEGNSLDAPALELVGGLASVVLERQANTALHAQIAPAPIPRPSSPAVGLPPWASLNAEQRALHIRAQRFSRAAIAEMQLAAPEISRAGREQQNLYLFLKNEIDRARETYRNQFLTIPSMVDYLHLELVRTAGEGDEKLLGAEYPGALV